MARAYKTTAKDYSGMKFGRLTAVESTAMRSGNNIVWLCLCECGNETFVHSGNLKKGNTQSCGCLKKERITHHGQTSNGNNGGTREYWCWNSMRQRCINPKNPKYPRYGGRGIAVCERWSNSFENFFADMGTCPPGKTLERANGNGNYEPGNCLWAGYEKQNRNTSQNVWAVIGGVRKCMEDWCRHFGINRNTVNARRRRGWTLEKALSTPLIIQHSNSKAS